MDFQHNSFLKLEASWTTCTFPSV